MSLLLPGHAASSRGEGPFDQAFFEREFVDGGARRCSAIHDGAPDGAYVTVVELVLANGESPDIDRFEEFHREYLVAQVFVDPPDCRELYRSYIRYDTIFKVNVREYPAKTRRLGFHAARPAVVERPPPEPLKG